MTQELKLQTNLQMLQGMIEPLLAASLAATAAPQ